jgi:hypothetical protein
MAKKIIVIIFMFLFSSYAQAQQEWLQLTAKTNFYTYASQEVRAQPSFEVRVGRDNLFLSLEKENFRYHSMDMSFTGIGIGKQVEILDGLFLEIKLAYYMPDSDGAMPSEAGYYFMNRQWSWIYGATSFDHYQVKLDNAIGGALALDYKKKIMRNVDVGLGAGYRYLRVNERYDSWDNGGAPGVTGWLYEREGQFDAFFCSVFLQVSF